MAYWVEYDNWTVNLNADIPSSVQLSNNTNLSDCAIYHFHTVERYVGVRDGRCWICNAKPPASIKFISRTRKLTAAR